MSNLSLIVLLALALVIPIVGFAMAISHARKGDTAREQRWRKRHGLVFWSLIPGIAGFITVLGVAQVLPSIFSLAGIVVLALSTSLSMYLQKKQEE